MAGKSSHKVVIVLIVLSLILSIISIGINFLIVGNSPKIIPAKNIVPSSKLSTGSAVVGFVVEGINSPVGVERSP